MTRVRVDGVIEQLNNGISAPVVDLKKLEEFGFRGAINCAVDSLGLCFDRDWEWHSDGTCVVLRASH